MASLNVDYVTQSNKDTITKLNGQLDFVNKENHRLETELSHANTEIAEVDKFLKDRSNLSASLIAMQNKNKTLSAQIKQMDCVIRELKVEKSENEDPNLSNKLVDVKDLEAEQDKAATFALKVEELSLDKKRLEARLSDIDHIKSAYNSDKRAYNEALTDYKGANDNLKHEHSEIDARLHLVEKEREQLKSDVSFYKERLTTLEQNYEASKQTMSRLNMEKQDQVSGQDHLWERIKGLEDDLEKTVKERDDVKYEAQRIKEHKDSFDQQYDDLKRETIKVRNEFESGSQQVAWMEREINNFSQQVQVLKEEKRGLEMALDRSKDT